MDETRSTRWSKDFLRRLIDGDPRAWEAFDAEFRAQLGRLNRILQHLGAAGDDGSDLRQELLVEVVKKVRLLARAEQRAFDLLDLVRRLEQQLESPAYWKQAFRFKASHRRNHQTVQTRALNQLFARAGVPGRGGDPLVADEQRALIRSAIATLGKDDLRVVYLHCWLGLTLREIGRRSGVSGQAVAKRWRRVVTQLRDVLTAGQPQEVACAD